MESFRQMNISFCIGNGTSRLGFDLSKLTEHGPTYGCNRIIEDYPVDNLVVCDRMLLIEIISKGYANKTNLYTRKRWETSVNCENLRFLPEPATSLKTRWDKEIHWGSGMHALNLAAIKGSDIIVMIGYDLYTKNVYGEHIVDPACWIYQTKVLMDKFKDIQFVQVQNKNWENPESWNNENYLRDDFKGLKNLLKNLK